MMKQVPIYFQKYTSRSNVCFLFIIIILMIGVILPEAEMEIELHSGGFGLIDNSIFYQPAIFYERLEEYGVHGRKLYLFILLTADLFLTIILTLFFSFLIALFLKSSGIKRLKKLLQLPFAFFAINILENAGITFLLLSYPAKLTLFARLVAIFTLCKWIALGGLIAISLTLIFSKMWSQIKSLESLVRNGRVL